MKIDIIDFYPILQTQKFIRGTFHAYIEDLDIDLRGCFFSYNKKKKFLFVQPPHRKGLDSDSGEMIPFEVFSFGNYSKHEIFKNALITAAHKAWNNEDLMEIMRRIPVSQEKPRERKKPFQKKSTGF